MPEGKRRNTVTPFLGQELSERWSHCQSALLFRRTRPTTNGTYSHFANRSARQKSLYTIEACPSIMGQLLFQPAMFTRTLIFRLDKWTARSGVDVTFVVKGLCGYTSLPLRINRFSLTLKSLAMGFNESLNSRVIFTRKHELRSFKYLTIYLEQSLSNYRRFEIVLKPGNKKKKFEDHTQVTENRTSFHQGDRNHCQTRRILSILPDTVRVSIRELRFLTQCETFRTAPRRFPNFLSVNWNHSNTLR